MITAETYSIKGTLLEKTKLPEKVFGVSVKPQLLAQTVRVYLSNQRQANAKTKTRAEVAKTTAKMYRQKGTGRARHGSYAAPIFVGGGIAHGPTGWQNYKMSLNRGMRRSATGGALSVKAKQKEIIVLDGGNKMPGKTKDASGWLKKLKLTGDKLLLVVTGEQKNIRQAFGNLPLIDVLEANNLNAYSVLAHKKLVITTEAVNQLDKKYVD